MPMKKNNSKFGTYNLLCSFLNFIITLGIFLFTLWFIYHPKTVQVHVESASITAFDLANTTNTLTYNLTLTISVRNPNNRVGFYYDYILAQALYGGSAFGLDAGLPAFFQRRKNTTVLRPAFAGRASVLGTVAERLNREVNGGFFYVELRVYADLRLKFEFVKVGHFKREVHCIVKIPVPATNSSGNVLFERTKCDVDKF